MTIELPDQMALFWRVGALRRSRQKPRTEAVGGSGFLYAFEVPDVLAENAVRCFGQCARARAELHARAIGSGYQGNSAAVGNRECTAGNGSNCTGGPGRRACPGTRIRHRESCPA